MLAVRIREPIGNSFLLSGERVSGMVAASYCDCSDIVTLR